QLGRAAAALTRPSVEDDERPLPEPELPQVAVELHEPLVLGILLARAPHLELDSLSLLDAPSLGVAVGPAQEQVDAPAAGPVLAVEDGLDDPLDARLLKPGRQRVEVRRARG